MSANDAIPASNFTDPNTLSGGLKQLGIATLYALLLYVGELHFESDAVAGYFEPASGLALAALLIGGKRYAWGVLLGATLIHAISGGSLRETVIVASGDTLQALCGAWLLTRGGKLDLRLQSLHGYLRLILLGGCAGIAVGALAANTGLLISGLLAPGNYFHSLLQWWMSDTLGAILIAPLILVWRQTKNDWREAGKMIEAVMLLGLTILVSQIVFLDWLHESIGQVAKGYWMFMLITWAAVRLGTRETAIVLAMTAVYALLGAMYGTGLFAADIVQTHLANYWFYMVTLSVVGMALATHFAEREQAGERLRDSEELLRQTQSIATTGSWRLNVPRKELAWSDETYRLFGIPAGTPLRYESFLGPVHPDDRAMIDSAWQAALKGAPYRIQHRVVVDGETRWVEGRARFDFDALGNLHSGTGSVQDITERKRAETDLRIASVAFESQESMVITDAGGVILRVNKAFTDTTGYTSEEVVGQTPSLLKSGRHNADFYREMWETLRRTGTWQGEIWDRRKNGEIYPKWLTISAVKGAGGAVTHYVGSHLDMTERKAAEDEIKHLAFYDSLTCLPNRRLLMDRLQQALASGARSGREGALLFIDLDNFKTLNDTLGHDIGDLLLQQVAQRLESCVREGDTVARLGGDEFVVMLEDLSEHPPEAAAQAEAAGEKILATLNQPYRLAAHEHRSTPSIGATLFSNHGQTRDELLKQADIAMYQAKTSGRNALCFFDPQMQAAVNARAALEGELRKALEGRQFHLYYQIQVDGSHRPLGAEALIRWIHPERGLVPPAQFIPLAEETGLILPIWQWLLEAVCAQLKAWQRDALTRNLVLTMIVSAKQFRQADLVAQVQTAVQRHAINPMLLKLELTESALLENIEGNIATMNALKEIGIRFSLDDFGTGYSSLQYLKRVPLDQIKIDQSFIRDIAADSSDKAIVRTIIALAQNLNLDVIAEGVDTEAQRQRLLNKGCSNYQGYLFGKPVPLECREQMKCPVL